MRGVIVGTGWGRTHIHTLRSHGVDVVAICGAPIDSDRTEAVARAEQVPVALHDVAQVRALRPDVVVVATPARTHAQVLHTLSGLPVICEKPLLGVSGDAAQLPDGDAPVLVNYAFAFLDSARAFCAAFEQFGAAAPVAGPRHRRAHVNVTTAYDLPLSFTPREWFFEGASHPLSFVAHLLGPPTAGMPSRRGADEAGVVTADLRLGEIPARVISRHEPGLHGMRHRVAVSVGATTLELTGEFRAGGPWAFGPVVVDGQPVSDVERGDEDCWRRASTRAVGLALAVIRGHVGVAEAVCQGLYTARRALALDLAVRAAWSGERIERRDNADLSG